MTRSPCARVAGSFQKEVTSTVLWLRNFKLRIWYVMQLGSIYYDARRYKDAIETIESLRNFETIWTDFYLAASHAQIGHEMEARRALQGALKFDPQATIEGWITPENIPHKDPSYREHFAEGLRKAGLPER